MRGDDATALGTQASALPGDAAGVAADLHKDAATADRDVESGTYACGVEHYKKGDYTDAENRPGTNHFLVQGLACTTQLRQLSRRSLGGRALAALRLRGAQPGELGLILVVLELELSGAVLGTCQGLGLLALGGAGLVPLTLGGALAGLGGRQLRGVPCGALGQLRGGVLRALPLGGTGGLGGAGALLGAVAWARAAASRSRRAASASVRAVSRSATAARPSRSALAAVAAASFAAVAVRARSSAWSARAGVEYA